jgi:hypothetical protein
MMAELQKEPILLFGKPFEGSLPDGWRLQESEDDFARGFDPEGREYLLGRDKAYPITHIAGVRTVDLQNPIRLKDGN